jgi:sulfoxide reductase heme-binding subunit YedZ
MAATCGRGFLEPRRSPNREIRGEVARPPSEFLRWEFSESVSSPVCPQNSITVPNIPRINLSMTTTGIIKKSYWLRRTKRHLVLLVLASAITWAAYAVTPPPDIRHRLSMSTAYAALVFLAISLVLGPWNILRRRPNPVSFDLRRDLGIWAGIIAILHTAVGLTVHLRGRMWMYFFRRLHPLALQNTQFGLANYTGLGAALLFLMLLALSNDASLRALGTRSWKSAQRWIYVVFGLTIVHGIAYQLVEKRHLPWIIIFGSVTLLVFTIQFFGFVRMRKTFRIKPQK